MKEILGLDRILLITFLVAIVAASYSYAQYVAVPERTAAEQNYQGLKSQVTARIEEIRKLKEEYAILQNQLRNYKAIEARGFFNDQNRVDAQKDFDALRSQSGLLKAGYTISPGQMIEDVEAAKADYVVLRSPVKVSMEALDDVDVYNFLKLILERYPGTIDLTSLSIKRDEEVSASILRQIGSGLPNKMVTSTIEFSWRTMASRKLIDETMMRESGAAPPPLAIDPNTGAPITPVPGATP